MSVESINKKWCRSTQAEYIKHRRKKYRSPEGRRSAVPFLYIHSSPLQKVYKYVATRTDRQVRKSLPTFVFTE